MARFDGREHVYGFGELDTLVPAYATTVHKSRGSEYPAVVIPVLTQHYAMLKRNLLYTGVTRGKGLVVLVGQLIHDTARQTLPREPGSRTHEGSPRPPTCLTDSAFPLRRNFPRTPGSSPPKQTFEQRLNNVQDSSEALPYPFHGS